MWSAWSAVGSREPYSWILPCRMLGDMGNSCWKMPCTGLHGMTRDEPCSCSISCGRINSVCRITWSCWIACGDTVVLVGMWNTTVFEDRLKNLSLDLLSSLLGNNSVHRIIVLVLMTGSMLEACGFDHMFSLLKRCKYSLYSDTMLYFGSTNPCRIHAMNWSGVSNETNKDVHMYIEEYLF